MRGRYGYVVLALLSFVLAGMSVLISLHEIDVNNHKFCDIINATTATKIAKPANPKHDPSREQQWEWYMRFLNYGRSIGCD